uniref:Putative lipoate-protein ligase A n=1 Tax=Schizophyllum commune (strain H4-8 / FGSC 9210) TaxID=578458 RepID=D8PNI2_SCHCM
MTSARFVVPRLRSPLSPPSRRFSLSQCTRSSNTGLPSLDRSIYLSESTDPYFNLTIEDWLFRKADPSRPLLFLYRNTPCVVLGRNQNPWKEINLAALRQTSIPFIRRRSGGGTVYHDLGNTNYSIHVPRTWFDRNVTSQIVLRAVRGMGVPGATVNERNDVCVGTDKMIDRLCLPAFLYVSGSAYKIVSSRAYHHGTMLISTQLQTLGSLLRSGKQESMTTKGVASVRSPVCNLQLFDSSLSHEAFADSMVREFQREYGVTEEPCIVRESEEAQADGYIKKGMEELPSWEWAYGQTPEFEYTVSKTFPWGVVTAVIRSKRGLITGCDVALKDSTLALDFAPLDNLFRDMRYGFVDVDEPADVVARLTGSNEAGAGDRRTEVYAWLREVMSER